MKIHQIFTDNALRNFNYIIEFIQGKVLVVDPWDGNEIQELLGDRQILAILNTHEHHDHIKGNDYLKSQTGCEIWAHENAKGKIPNVDRYLKNGERISLTPSWEMEVLDTPGHTMAHLSFLLHKDDNPYCVFTGDTLFNAGVGNCHNGGDPKVLYKTITEIFSRLPEDVIVYPGHEYFDNNLRFTLDREPENEDAREMLTKVKEIDWLSGPFQNTIGGEKRINTFLRLQSLNIRTNLNMENEEDQSVFLKLRDLRNHW